MRSPGIAIGVFSHGRVFGEQLGDVEQVGNVSQGSGNGNATVNAEQGLISVEGERREAKGGKAFEVSHWAPPLLRVGQLSDRSGARIGKTPISGESYHVRYQANGWQLCAG